MEGSKKSKKIVCFGGGTALPQAIIGGLKKYPVRITSVTSMLESGGSTGQLRKDFNVLPAGDISRHLVALSEAPKWKKELFCLRFGKEKFPGGHIGHRFGTVFISLAEYVNKDFEKALKIAEDFLEIKKHKALPISLAKTHLQAELENKAIIKGEDEIDVPKQHNPRFKIKKVFLKPMVKAYPPVLEKIQKADLLIIGPGDLYSSVIPCFLPAGIKEAIKKTKAKKVLIINSMNKLGETNNFSVLDFTKEVQKYMGCPFDFVLYNTRVPDPKRIKDYKKENPLILNLVNINENLDEKKFIGRNFLIKSGPIIYDKNKIIKILLEL